MDIQPKTTQPISDDQELAKVLAGINAEADGVSAAPPVLAPAAVAAPQPPTMADPSFSPPAMAMANASGPMTNAMGGDDLTTVKQEAISELRPLVDKLNVNAEEKFDTYLLLIRSTDDRTLIAPAHEAAKAITDETRRAQALLDIIKEIDFLSNPQQQ